MICARSLTRRPTNPILSAEYHRLLVTVTPGCAAPAAAPLSLLGTYITSCKAAAEKGTSYDLEALAPAATSSFALLFNESKAEAWAEMWGVLVSALAVVPVGSPAAAALTPAVDLICGSLALALPTSPNAKKIASAAHVHLPAYAKASAHGFTALEELTPTLFFPVQTLQTVEPLKAALAPLATSTAEAELRPALALLPHLFDAFVASTLKHRYVLYSKTNADRPIDVIVADRVRGAVIPALGSALELSNKVEGGSRSVPLADAVWGARLRMWNTLVSWGGYLETEERAGALVAAEAKRAAAALAAYGATEANAVDEGLAGKILRTLDALERLDHTRAAVDTVVLGWCLASPARTHAAARTLLASVLRFHQLTHTLPQFIELIADAISGLFDAALPPPALAAVYTLVAGGPISDKAFVDDLGAAVRSANLAGRRSAAWAGMLDDIGRRVRTALSADASVGEKRKRAAGVADAPARLVGVLSRLAAVLLNAGARAKAGDDEVEGAIGAIARAFVPDDDNEDEDESDTKKKRKSEAARSVPADIVTAARLRVSRAATLVEECETGTSVSVAIASAAPTATPELRLEAFRFLVTFLALTAHNDDGSERAGAVDAVLGLLSAPGTAAWTGRDATVTSASLAGACWTVLAQNGLGVLDATATAAQLDTLAVVLTSLAQSDETSGLTPHAAVTRLLRTAETWELISVRSALLRALSSKASGTFAVLSCCPASWLSKGARGALLEAAYADKDKADKAAIRAWLARLAGNGILGPLDADKLDSVLKKAGGAEEETLALAKAALPHLVRSSLPALLDNAASVLKKNKDKDGDVRVRSVPLLLSALCALSLDKVESDHKAKLENLEAAARKALTPRAEAALAGDDTEALEAYRVLNKYAHWLGKEDASDIGARLLSRVLRSSDDHLAVIALDLVPRSSALAAFLLLSASHSTPDLDAAFKAHVRSLNAEDYADALTSLVRRCGDKSPVAVATALRAARILVSAPVEGSGRAIAATLAPLLAAVDAAAHVRSVRVLQEALQFISALVDERVSPTPNNPADSRPASCAPTTPRRSSQRSPPPFCHLHLPPCRPHRTSSRSPSPRCSRSHGTAPTWCCPRCQPTSLRCPLPSLYSSARAAAQAGNASRPPAHSGCRLIPRTTAHRPTRRCWHARSWRSAPPESFQLQERGSRNPSLGRWASTPPRSSSHTRAPRRTRGLPLVPRSAPSLSRASLRSVMSSRPEVGRTGAGAKAKVSARRLGSRRTRASARCGLICGARGAGGGILVRDRQVYGMQIIGIAVLHRDRVARSKLVSWLFARLLFITYA